LKRKRGKNGKLIVMRGSISAKHGSSGGLSFRTGARILRAEKYRNARNVGVIGIALLNELGSDPWTNEEVRRRVKANPFPGRFGTPP
jgi:hypothetical protein